MTASIITATCTATSFSVQVSPHLEMHLCQIAISKNKLGDFGSSADKIYLLKNLFNAFREFLIRL
jgi:hypothetical protein